MKITRIVAEEAYRDIREDLNKQGINTMMDMSADYPDTWTITFAQLYTDESKKLNSELKEW